GLLHGLLLQELSAKTGIDQSTLAELAEQIAKQPPPQSPSAQPRQADENHSTATAQTELGGSDNFRYVLRLILQLPRLALNLDQQLLDRLDHDRLLARIRKRVKAKPDVNFVHLHGTWLAQDPTLARKLQRFFGARLLKEPTAEKLERDYEETLAHLQSEHEHEQDNHEIIHEFNTPYNEMSTEQRAKIQALHWHRSKLPQHQPHHAHP
ncbi:MAG: hypothetical protein GDA55_07590, partial [Cellvibrionales bacterium]|nr:hypothetical protein [Cellvibrionales bacterium]